MKVELEVPDRVWWLLGGNAERAGKHIDGLLQDALDAALGSSVKRLQTSRQRQDRVIALALGGLTITQIVEETDETRNYVQHALAAAGVKAPKPKRSVSSPEPADHLSRIAVYDGNQAFPPERVYWARCSLHQWNSPRTTTAEERDRYVGEHLGALPKEER